MLSAGSLRHLLHLIEQCLLLPGLGFRGWVKVRRHVLNASRHGKPEELTTTVPGVLVATGGINYDEVVLLFLEKLHAWQGESLQILQANIHAWVHPLAAYITQLWN